MLSFANECKVLVCKSEVAAGTTAVEDATIVDMQGYDSVAFVAILGADTATTAEVALSAVCGNDAALSDGVEKAAKAEYTAASDTDADGKTLVLDVIRPGTRYARAKVGRATANAEVLAVLAVLYMGSGIPGEAGDALARAVSVN